MKIQRKIVYIRCIEGSYSWKNSNLLRVRYRENSMDNCVRWKYRLFEYVEKFKFVKSKISRKVKGKLYTLDVQKVQICERIRIR